MKKILSVLLILLASFQVKACDICGCSSGNYFLGPTPQFNKNFIGLRYSFRSYHTVLKNDPSQFSRDFYQTTELWAGFKVMERIQVLAFIPYNINQSVTDDGLKMNQGLGDATLIGNVNVLNKRYITTDTLSAMQQVWIGAGVKLPTGRFSPNPAEPVSSANSQPGSGSLDFLVSASYLAVVDVWGVTGNLTYKINQSASGYRFGNRLTASVFATKPSSLTPMWACYSKIYKPTISPASPWRIRVVMHCRLPWELKQSEKGLPWA
jgi:hypothetical protein